MTRNTLTTTDINDPNHKAEPAELAVGFAAAVSALITAGILTHFHPKRK